MSPEQSFLENIIITEFHNDNALFVSSLIKKSFDKFLVNDFEPSGEKEFLEYISPENLCARCTKNSVFIARFKSLIIGVIEVEYNNRIKLFFVDEHYQNNGIGKKLLNQAKELARSTGNHTLSIHSSINAVPINKRLGFIEKENIKARYGRVYQQMLLLI